MQVSGSLSSAAISGLQRANDVLRTNQLWKCGEEMAAAAINDIEHLPLPGARPDVEERRSGSIAGFRTQSSGEPEIQIIVGQQDVAYARKVLRLALFEPK